MVCGYFDIGNLIALKSIQRNSQKSADCNDIGDDFRRVDGGRNRRGLRCGRGRLGGSVWVAKPVGAPADGGCGWHCPHYADKSNRPLQLVFCRPWQTWTGREGLICRRRRVAEFQVPGLWNKSRIRKAAQTRKKS